MHACDLDRRFGSIQVVQSAKGILTIIMKINNVPWDQGHHGCNGIWDMACFCNNGSSERDDDPSCSSKKYGMKLRL